MNNPKQLNFGDAGRQKLIRGIETISLAVKSTLGPMGNTVLIESPSHTHGITVTKDGVTVAKSINLIDPVEDLAVRMVKEAADRTATSAGDGTTTAIVLTEALVQNGFDRINEANRTDVLRELVDLTSGVVSRLKKQRRKVTKSRLRDVAYISANNDKHIGDIIANAYNEVGENGVVTVERSQTQHTYYDTTHGIKVDRGYSSPLFINNHKKDECILNDAYILVSDAEISNVLQIEDLLRPIVRDGKRLLIIAPCHTNVTNTLAANVIKRGIQVCVIQPPSFGYKQHELMQDIALSVGATYFSEKTGDDLSLMSFDDLGLCDRVIVSRDSTVIIKENKDKSQEVVERIAQLNQAYENETKQVERDFILSRIASLTGGIGVIYVGGNTDLEQKELYDRVDDAVCAVRSALEEGILPGGGVALFKASAYLDDMTCSVAQHILCEALRAPLRQIFQNAGLAIDSDMEERLLYDQCNDGLNVKTGQWGDMYKMGVIDPLKVTRSALQNAVSVAVSILSTNAIVTIARADD
jgi:chaperonin GroEL